MKKVVVASGNPGKLREIGNMLKELEIEVVPQSEFGVPEAEETGTTFVENAIIKARNAARHSGLPAIADDSGIEVDALGGAPGVYSARYGGPEAGDGDNNRKLLEALTDVADEQRTARYQAVLVYMEHADDPTPLISQGSWEGRILREPVGENGFGYDPIFMVTSEACSAAELEPAIKNRLSHRGKALRKLVDLLQSNTP
ncbi:MAG: RdgB/HAM1 family non-canonical purine NTP pyrophosphatase [Gammaproteobacteria bacterium]|nr:RdgB/HAM1 family non-canonical purine NTP pyrophosphatase [Gammaproteobacteria bacterium]